MQVLRKFLVKFRAQKSNLFQQNQLTFLVYTLLTTIPLNPHILKEPNLMDISEVKGLWENSQLFSFEKSTIQLLTVSIVI